MEKAEQQLAPLSAVIKPQVVKKVAEIKREVQKQPEAPAVDFEALKEQEAEAAVRGILAQFEDQALADELRRRGYEVTATKTVVISL